MGLEETHDPVPASPSVSFPFLVSVHVESRFPCRQDPPTPSASRPTLLPEEGTGEGTSPLHYPLVPVLFPVVVPVPRVSVLPLCLLTPGPVPVSRRVGLTPVDPVRR